MVRLLLQFRLLGFDLSACSINRDSPWDSLRDKAFPRWFAFCCSVVFLVSTLLVARCGASFWLPCQIQSVLSSCSIFLLSAFLVISFCCFFQATLSCRVLQNDLLKRSMLVFLSGASFWKLHQASQGILQGLPRRLPRPHSPQNDETFSRWFAFRCLFH